MTEITLYYSPGSCSLASHILLHESGVPFSTTEINVFKGFPTSRRDLNPKLRVPILALDNEIITESPAIMLAISQMCPDKQLMGASNLERVRVAEWMNWLSGTLHGQAFGGLLRPARYTDDESMYDAIRAKSKQTVLDLFKAIEDKLSGLHAIGDRFTAVDAFLYVFYRWGNVMGVNMRQDYTKYAALVEELYRRPAVKAAVQAESIEPYVQQS